MASIRTLRALIDGGRLALPGHSRVHLHTPSFRRT